MSGNGNGVTKLASALINALPPSFLALLAINVVFIGALFWFEERQNTSRAKVLTHLIDACEADLALKSH